MTDDEHEAYGAMIHRVKAEEPASAAKSDDNLVDACLREFFKREACWTADQVNGMRAALAVARAAILEQAAKVAEQCGDDLDNDVLWPCEHVAAAIRRLAKGGA